MQTMVASGDKIEILYLLKTIEISTNRTDFADQLIRTPDFIIIYYKFGLHSLILGPVACRALIGYISNFQLPIYTTDLESRGRRTTL